MNLDAASSFVLCWTPTPASTGAGRASGGTGQALRIAVGHGIAVLNLARPDHERRIRRLPQHPPRA